MTDSRAFEMTLEIAVPADAVWQALTDAEELVRWFPLQAEVQPGQGGTWRISWDGSWPWNTAIEIWEPQRHLRLVDRNARPHAVDGKSSRDAVAPMPIAIDWYLEAGAGSTSLRLVHSGFGRGSAWDDEFEGVSHGWPLELQGLKHYLERHRGKTRRVSWQRTVVAAPVAAAWSRLVGPDGILRDLPPAAERAGERYEATLSTGERLAGTAVVFIPGHAVQLTVDGWNDGIFRLWIDRVGEQCAVNAWLTAYDRPQDAVDAFDARMAREMSRLAAMVAA